MLNRLETIYFITFYFSILTDVNECQDKPCGEPCLDGICDGRGRCTDALENPCAVQGSKGKKCGEDCLEGDVLGICDDSGLCEFDVSAVQCQSNF